MEAAKVLQLHPQPDGFPWPDDNGELLSVSDARHRVRDLLDERDGLIKLTRKQAKENAALSRQIAEEADVTHHEKGKEILSLLERWRTATGHLKSKDSADRIKMVKSRLRDGYSIEQLEQAVDGIGAYRFVVAAKRAKDGHQSQRFDELSHAIGSGEKVEKAARLGYAARQQGWTLEGGWGAEG